MKRLAPDEGHHALEGFNNLTKCLRTNLYIMPDASVDYAEILRTRYAAFHLERMLQEIARRIEAVVLASSQQDYKPWGASALMLLSDGGPSAVQMHLNKSHLCAHTYPDFGADGQLPCLRIDLDLSSCGTISPLRSLDFILDCLQPSAALIDYSVRGFTRDVSGSVLFQDHPLTRLGSSLDSDWFRTFEVQDAIGNFPQTWQMKMLRHSLAHSVRDQLRSFLQWQSPPLT